MARRNTRKYKKNRSHKKTKRMVGGVAEETNNTPKTLTNEIPYTKETPETPSKDIPVAEETTLAETPTNDIPFAEETPTNDIPVAEETPTPANQEEIQETSETEKPLDTPPVDKDELTEIIERIKTLINAKPDFEEYKSKLDNIDLNNITDKSKSIELFKSVEEKLQSLIGTAPPLLSETSTSTSTETNETNKQKIPDGMVQILIPKENEHMVKECLIKKGCPVSEYNKDGDLITTNPSS